MRCSIYFIEKFQGDPGHRGKQGEFGKVGDVVSKSLKVTNFWNLQLKYLNNF